MKIVKSFVLISMINATGCLIRIALNLQITSAIIVIFTILILPVQDHSMSLYAFVDFDFFCQYPIVFRQWAFAFLDLLSRYFFLL